MEINLLMNPKMERMVPWLYEARTRPKSCKVNTISCMAKRLAMQKGKTNFYEVLSLGSEKVGFEEIKKAYRAMALQYHPDVCPPSCQDESTQRFVKLREAYETLSDPVSRKIYDYEMGFVDPLEWNCHWVEERRLRFPKDVWERQLGGLKKRSGDRMERKKNQYM